MKVTLSDLKRLLDIYWWFKGYKAGAGDNFEKCPFVNAHFEVLEIAMKLLKAEYHKEGESSDGQAC